MINYLDLIAFSFYILSTIVLISLAIKLSIAKKKMIALYIQSELDKHLVYQKLEEVSKELSAKNLTETDGFIKFISQSRDWAFEYIEEVQNALAAFDEEVSPQFESASDSDKTVKEISEAYDKLKTVLPKNTETPNN